MASPVSQDFIQELISRADIVSVIDSRVPLTQAGREYKACCPFHNEKTPSFYVSPAKQFYHCFGCGESGTALQFLMKYGNYRFPDAVEELAASVGMQVPRGYAKTPQDGQYAKLLELMAKVNSEFHRQLLKNHDTASAREYLKDRQISFETAQNFGLGYAPDQWDFLLKKFGQTKEDRKLLEDAGLIVAKDKGRFYDRFRGRLMFPIEDRRGRVIAFGGRVLGEGEPKYLNSPETILFKKGNELFGFKKALSAIKKEQRVLVVEGYTDVVALAQAGIGNVVATLGTAVTPYHIKGLFRTIHEVVFCFDGDEAGKRAAWRAVATILPVMEDGHLVSFVFLPQGQDPDSMVREEGSEAFRERMLHGEPIDEFIFRILLERSDISRTDGRAKFAAEFGNVIDRLQEGMLRQMMLSELSKRTGLSVSEIKSVLKPAHSDPGVGRDTPGAVNPHSLTGQFITLLVQNPHLVHDPDLVKQVEELEDVEVLSDSNIDLLLRILAYLRQQPDPTTAALVENFRETNYFEQIQYYARVKSNSDDGNICSEFRGALLRLQERITKQINKNLLSRQRNLAINDADYEEALQRLKNEHALKKKAYEG